MHFTSPDKILYGSDWPYAPEQVGTATTADLDEAFKDARLAKFLQGSHNQNAKKLFGW